MKNIWKISLGILSIIVLFSCEKENPLALQNELNSELHSLNIIDQNTAEQGLVAQGNDKITLILDTGQTVVIDGPTNYVVPTGSTITSMIIEVDVVMLPPCNINTVAVGFSTTNGWSVAIGTLDENGVGAVSRFTSWDLGVSTVGALAIACS